jgi:hypothetical protein
VRETAPDAAIDALEAEPLPPCAGGYRPDYKPDESSRLEKAREWIAIARSGKAVRS